MSMFSGRKEPKTTYLKDYQKPSFLIPEIEIHFDLFEEYTRVRSRLTLKKNPAISVTSQPLILNGENLKLLSVRLNEEVLSEKDYKITESTMEIAAVSENAVLEIETEIKPHLNHSLEGLYKSGDVFCTQNESEGFRKITYFLDRPDVMSRFTTTLTADKSKYPYLLSNGNLKESKDLPGGRHWVKWQDPFPKPCYLFALVAGNFDTLVDSFTTQSGRKVELKIFVDPGNQSQAVYAMECLKKAMKWDEETFSLEYDLDLYMVVAVDAFNFGAMENKGLNIFNSQYALADQTTATDQNFLAILGVIGHEYFHNWTGNRVTCRDWFQITLKEGLTILRDQEFSSDMTSRGHRRIEDVRVMKDYQFAEDAGPNRHPIRPASYIEVGNFYTTTVYQKGAEVIRMIMTLIGREKFKRGISKYFELFDGQAVATEDFIHAMERVSGLDLTQFKHWYDFSGTPICRVKTEYEPERKVFTLSIEQEAPQNPEGGPIPPFHFPFAFALLGHDGREMDLCLEKGEKAQGEIILQVTERKHVFRFINVHERPVPSLLRNFSAPVKLESDLSCEELLFLLEKDSDPVNRYESGQILARRDLHAGVKKLKEGQSYCPDAKVISAFASALGLADKDPAFAAEVLIPPSEASLNEDLEIAQFEDVHHARRSFIEQICKNFEASAVEVYQRLAAAQGAYRIDPISIGKRSLKNTLLHFLSMSFPEKYAGMAWEQFRWADNMTDSIASLAALLETDAREKSEALQVFYERWKANPLVMNKWFAVQAGAKKGPILKHVTALQKDAAFDFKNPNKIRALFGTFAGNLIHFHEATGIAYDLMAKTIMQVDEFNPSAAAKLSACFRKYKRLDPLRKEKMGEALRSIVDKPGLSKETFEIISKTLK